jgi:hypothetical protein
MMNHTEMNERAHANAYQALAAVFALAFKFLAWINGFGILVVLLASVGVVDTGISPYLLRLPLAAFLAGVALCGVGLLWSYLVQASLFSQLLNGRSRRTHWVPMFCVMIAYSLSLVAFLIGCWFTLNLSAWAYHASSYSQPSEENTSPSDQSGVMPANRVPLPKLRV